MRLLNVHTYKREEFFGDKIPKYTILSHTWGEEEVSFADFDLPNVEQQEGWKKTEYICKETRRDGGVHHCWVDTCCIDKSNSAELSEAINSMFMWYEKAKVCYAYLADVSTYYSDERKGEISNSRWFTRGWTLQELLAPKRVEFYDANWKALGTKSELAEIISGWTGIDVEVLQNHLNLNQKSIAARMSWASNRQTTRVEDIAYCLLGIFGVNMPLLYGEGEKAFIRLQEEILKISLDLSVLAWDFQNKDIGSEHWQYHARERTSILAPHPRHFADSENVERTPYIYGPFSMTNLGLEIKLPIFKLVGNLYCAVLGCRMKDQEELFLAMMLYNEGEAETFSRLKAKLDEFVTGILAFNQAIDAIPQNLTILRDLEYVEQRASHRLRQRLSGDKRDFLPYILVRLIDDAENWFEDDVPAFLWPKEIRWEKTEGSYFGKAHIGDLGLSARVSRNPAMFVFRIQTGGRNYGETKALMFVMEGRSAVLSAWCSQIPARIEDSHDAESWQKWAIGESQKFSDTSGRSCINVPVGFMASGFTQNLVLTAEKVRLYDKFVIKVTIQGQKFNPSTGEVIKY